MTQQEHNRLLLRMFQGRRVKPGHMLPYQVLLGGFANNGLNGSDLDTAIRALQREGTLRQERPTEPVFLAAKPSKAPGRAAREPVIKGFFGAYTINRQIGEGTAGTVFLVTGENGQQHALKRLDVRKANTDRITRFRNEVHFCRQIKHPHIIEITDHGTTDDSLFYVMPYYPGTLRTRINARLSPEQALSLFHEMLDGVEAAHLKNVWHRDLKPENILVTADDHIVIADFGIAHIAEELLASTIRTDTDDRLANFRYAAPEQRNFRPTSQATDIYALGLILHELFTGEVIVGAGYQPVGGVVAAYAHLDAVVERMIQHDPAKRHKSIEDVKKDLIARGDDQVIRQRISTLERTVIPETDLDDPLINDPVRVIKKDYRAGTIILALNQAPTKDWLAAYPGGAYSSSGTIHPNMVKFSGAIANVPADEHWLAEHYRFATGWIEGTNTEYAKRKHEEHRKALAAERARLKAAQATEEQRRRVLERLNQLP
jgi:hypothetical protein